MARFWWKSHTDKNDIHWASWTKLSQLKKAGGLGFRDLQCFNMALLAKIGWRILHNPSSLLACSLHDKYFVGASFLTATSQKSSSWGWKGILQGRRLLESGLHWRIGDDTTVQVRSGLAQSSVWKSVWHVDAPPKLKAFIWRGCSNILAVRHNSHRRSVPCTGECGFCGFQDETQAHIFFECDFARAFWFASPLQLDVSKLAGEDFISTWQHMMTTLNSSEHAAEAIQWFVFGLWRIWKARNLAVFDGVQADPTEAVLLLLKQVSEFRTAKQDLQPQPLQPVSSPAPLSWCKPPPGLLKVNSDAAWSAQRMGGGVGWVIRDSFGLLLCAGGQGDLHGSSALMMELLAIRHALSECANFHLTDIIVESDSQKGILMLNGRATVDSDLEGIVFDIRQLVASLSRVSFVFAPSSCNQATHSVAGFVSKQGGNHVWDHLGTNWLFNFLTSDVNLHLRY
ncbi:unnamed protein product [Prunus armeniaca]|uniref:RNase H type-1 domain-containing protein n=1 Tax=Prunus armeniaca TaxID=36596 RepID=A0A6J5VSP2_PRUAR|nr:unnamed protein product [Prunus armeniaca]